MRFDNTDVTNSWKYLNFINSENASVMVVAMKRLYASRLTKCLFDLKLMFQVDYFEHGSER